MATYRAWLDAAGFDWEHGRIVEQIPPQTEFGYVNKYAPFDEWLARIVPHDDSMLDRVFSDGYGGVEAPHAIAEDKGHLYIIGCYDGSSWLEKISKNLRVYLRKEATVPIVGGG